MNEGVTKQRTVLQMTRLARLTDVVYGIVIWNFFTLIPGPDGEWYWDTVEEFLRGNASVLGLVVIGVAIGIVYWIQNNTLFSNIERTDSVHTALAIVHLFFLLVLILDFWFRICCGLWAVAWTSPA